MDTSSASPLLWAGFMSVIGILLGLDLGFFHRAVRTITVRESLLWVAFWCSLALLFAGFLAWQMHSVAALEFLSGYLIEQSLSLDNLFVMVLIFRSFGVPPEYQHRVLFWGILGAIVMRGATIFLGVGLVSHFNWLLYCFGGFLLLTGLKLLFGQESAPDPQQNFVLRFFRRFVPSTNVYHGRKFWVRDAGRIVATPLLAALVAIETMDLLFAIDSIPAIFAVTLDPYIVFTSNIFAILGLRSFYFVLASGIERFEYLQISLAMILSFVGAKMLMEPWIHISVVISLTVIAGVVLIAILTSVVKAKHHARK